MHSVSIRLRGTNKGSDTPTPLPRPFFSRPFSFSPRYPLTLVWGRYDTLHSPNLRRWLCKDDASPSAVPNEIPDGEEDEDGSQQEAQQVLLKLDEGDRPDDLSSSSSPFFGGDSEQASVVDTVRCPHPPPVWLCDLYSPVQQHAWSPQ